LRAACGVAGVISGKLIGNVGHFSFLSVRTRLASDCHLSRTEHHEKRKKSLFYLPTVKKALT